MTALLIVLLSFFLPTQFGYHFEELSRTVYGFRIDYFIPALYLTDLIALAIILLNFRKKQLFIVSVGLLVFLLTGTYKYLKITELVLLGTVLANYKKLNLFKHVYIPMTFSVLIICALGIAQTLTGGSLGGPFYYLGERTFAITTYGISTFTLLGKEFLRSYSTFSHPNSLAGFLFVFTLTTIAYRKKLKKKYFYLLAFFLTITLITCYSFNVVVSLVLLIILALFKFHRPAVLIVLLIVTAITFFIPKTNLNEIDYRKELAVSATKMFLEKLITGVGLNNFTLSLAEKSPIFKNSWELQPVHNIYLLLLSETGLVGFTIFALIIYKALKTKNKLLTAILLTGLFDHYWLTLQQNMMMFVLVIAMSFVKLKEWKKA